jgi:hypothetical protein
VVLNQLLVCSWATIFGAKKKVIVTIKFKAFILEHAPYFKPALEEISNLKSVNKDDIRMINHALKQVGNITYF